MLWRHTMSIEHTKKQSTRTAFWMKFHFLQVWTDDNDNWLFKQIMRSQIHHTNDENMWKFGCTMKITLTENKSISDIFQRLKELQKSQENIHHSCVCEFEVCWSRFNTQIETIHKRVQQWWSQSELFSIHTMQTWFLNEVLQKIRRHRIERENIQIVLIVLIRLQTLYDTTELLIENEILICFCRQAEQNTLCICEKKWIQSQWITALKTLWMTTHLQEIDELFKLILTQIQFQNFEEKWNTKAIQVWIVQRHKTNIETRTFSNTKTRFKQFNLFWIVNTHTKTSNRETRFQYWIQTWRLWMIWQSTKFNTKRIKQQSRSNTKTLCEKLSNRFIF